jgi:hypothetical protein
MTKMTMIKHSLAAVLAVVMGVGLAACEATVPNPVFPELTFQHLGPISLNVASLEISSSYKAPLAAPNVEHLFPTTPGSALKRWASDRLVAAGSGARANFTILDASVLEIALETKKGFKGAFTKDQSERYEGVLEARLQIFNDSDTSQGFVTARVSRSITVREDATVNDRAQAWFNLNEAMLKDINAELEKNISQYLGAWLL